MFATTVPPSKADAERLAAYRASHGTGADVPSASELCPSSSISAASRIADLVTLYTCPEDARRVYPDPPVHLLVDAEATSHTDQTTNDAQQEKTSTHGAIVQALKRARRESATEALRTAAATSSSPSTAIVGLTEAGTPRAAFVEGVERVNYLGRSFLEPPAAVLEKTEELQQKPCQPPRTLRGVFKVPESHVLLGAAIPDGGKKMPGVQQLRWAPATYGHLLFSADLAGQCRLWNTASRQMLATFSAHSQPIKSLEVTSDAAIMSTGSVDGTVAMWDVEAGRSTHVLTNPEKLPVVQHLHHPSDEAHLLLAAVDKKVVLYDVRVSASKHQREYTGHMGSIFNLTLLSDGSKMLTTAEDKTLRTWDYRSPVQIKQFADAAMHAITHVLHHPTQPEYLAAQSLDNKVIVFRDDGGGRLRLLHDREFTGHTISGTRCQLGFSHDGRYLSSGDIGGKLYVWDWASKKLEKSFKAHAQMLVSHLWHPLEPSRVVTTAWDGHIYQWV